MRKHDMQLVLVKSALYVHTGFFIVPALPENSDLFLNKV